MGAYLSTAKTDTSSSGESNSRMCYGASAMQGWRVSMEDAHSCLLDFDDDTSLFAVYDGHGGPEVAEYVAKHMAEILKEVDAYKDGNAKQALTDAFLKVDENLITEEGLKELKEIAGDNADDSGDENEADMLAKDANIPLSELLAKLKEGIDDAEEDSEEEEDSEDEKEKHMNGDVETTNENQRKNGASKENGETEGEEKEGKCDNDEEPKKVCVEAEQKNGGERETGEDEVEAAKDKETAGEKEEVEEKEEDEEGEEDEEEEDSESDDEEDDDEDEGVLVKSDEVGYDSGTTAIVALVKDRTLTVANVGDSRCVLCRNGIALDMSIDHKPEDEKELKRIKKAGGKVTCEGRVNGGLNLSRALGDHSYKGSTDLGAHEQQITAVPDIRQTELTESDEFIVIACDGIWNVKNSQEVVDFVKEKMKKSQNKEEEIKLSTICEELFHECLAPDTSGDGSGCDNMTCVIVSFNHNDLTSSPSKPGKRKASSDSVSGTDKKTRTE